MATMPATRPVGVTIIAILDFIGGGALLLVALGMVWGGAFLGAFLGQVVPWVGAAASAMFVVIGILLAIFGVLAILVGVGSMQGKPWAWMVQLVLSGLSGLGALGNMLRGQFGAIVQLAIAALIIWYYFTPPVKAFFGKSNVKTPWEKSGAAPPAMPPQ